MGILLLKISLGIALIISVFFIFGCLVCDTDNPKSKHFWREVYKWTKASWGTVGIVIFSLSICAILDLLLNIGHNVLAML